MSDKKISLIGNFEVLGPSPRRRDIPDKNFMQLAFFCCFRQRMAGMSRDLGRDVPDLEKLYARKLRADFSYPNFRTLTNPYFGIVQKVFSEKASAIGRMRQKCVRNASKWVLFYLGKEERSKMRQKCVKIASKMRQKCAEHLWGRTPFGRYRLLGTNPL